MKCTDLFQGERYIKIDWFDDTQLLHYSLRGRVKDLSDLSDSRGVCEDYYKC